MNVICVFKSLAIHFSSNRCTPNKLSIHYILASSSHSMLCVSCSPLGIIYTEIKRSERTEKAATKESIFTTVKKYVYHQQLTSMLNTDSRNLQTSHQRTVTAVHKSVQEALGDYENQCGSQDTAEEIEQEKEADQKCLPNKT